MTLTRSRRLMSVGRTLRLVKLLGKAVFCGAAGGGAGGGSAGAASATARITMQSSRKSRLLAGDSRRILLPASCKHNLRSAGEMERSRGRMIAAMPTRAEAEALLHEFTRSDALRKHGRAVEEAMRAYARWFGVTEGAEIDKWGIVGLLHDF